MQKQIEWWMFESKKLLPSSKHQQCSLSLWRGGINKLQLKVWTSLNCDIASIARLLNFTFPGYEMASVRRWDYRNIF